MQDLRPNDKRAKNAILLIQLVLAVQIISVVSDYFQYSLLKDLENGVAPAEGTAAANDLRQRIIGIVFLIMYIISTVTFIQWFRRASFNLHTKPNSLEYDEAAAAYCWFIPIVSLYQPYKIMKELYIGTDALLTRRNVASYTNKISTTTVGWWWTLWIISNIIGRVVLKSAFKTDTIDQLLDSTEVSMVSGIIDIPLAFLTIKVIKDYSNVEPLLFEADKEEPKETNSEGIIPA